MNGVKAVLVGLGVLLVGTGATAQDLESFWTKINPVNIWESVSGADPAKVAGGVGVNLRTYTEFGATENRQPPLSYTVTANLNITLFERINMPFSAVFTAQNSSTSNPFDLAAMKQALANRFVRVGASPSYKWAKLHVGHRSMNFSPLTYANQTFYGIGGEFNPGKYRIAFLKGALPTTTPQDLSLFNVNQQVFNRKANVIKLGYGTDKRFVDFIYMKGRDRNFDLTVNADSVLVVPEENSVVALNGQINLLKNLIARLEISQSAYSTNALAEGNDDTRLLHPGFVFTPNTSTTYTTAVNGGWQFQAGVMSLGMDYQRFAPGYRTMGVYYFNDDIENVTSTLGLNFSKIQLATNFTFGFQTNNLDDTQETTVKRTIGAANVTWSLQNLQTNFSYNNFSNSLEYVLNPTLDSLNAVIVTENTAATASYTLKTEGDAKHSFTLAATSQIVNSPAPTAGTGNNTGSRMRTLNLNYTLSPAEKTGMKWTVRANYNENAISGVLTDRLGFGLGITKPFLENKINLRFDNNYFIANSGGGQQRALTTRLTAGWKISPAHSLNLNLMVLNKIQEKDTERTDKTEMINALQYQYRFQYSFREWQEARAAADAGLDGIGETGAQPNPEGKLPVEKEDADAPDTEKTTRTKDKKKRRRKKQTAPDQETDEATPSETTTKTNKRNKKRKQGEPTPDN